MTVVAGYQEDDLIEQPAVDLFEELGSEVYNGHNGKTWDSHLFC